VIWLHGNSSSREEALTVMDSVIPMRISLVALDFSGCGHSEGDFITLGWHEQHDVAAVVTHLRADKNISSIVLWGRSMGAATALLYAAGDPNLAGVIADSSFASLAELCVESAGNYVPLMPTMLVTPVLSMIRSSILEKTGMDIDLVQPVDYAASITPPVLLGHSRDDEMIGVHHAEALAEVLPQGELCLFDGGHNGRRPFEWKRKGENFLKTVLQNELDASTRSHQISSESEEDTSNPTTGLENSSRPVAPVALNMSPLLEQAMRAARQSLNNCSSFSSDPTLLCQRETPSSEDRHNPEIELHPAGHDTMMQTNGSVDDDAAIMELPIGGGVPPDIDATDDDTGSVVPIITDPNSPGHSLGYSHNDDTLRRRHVNQLDEDPTIITTIITTGDTETDEDAAPRDRGFPVFHRHFFSTYENNDVNLKICIDLWEAYTPDEKSPWREAASLPASAGHYDDDASPKYDPAEHKFDNKLAKTCLRQAADDTEQPNEDQWLVFGFGGRTVEDAYQAELAGGRAQGVITTSIMVGVWGSLFAASGTVDPAEVLLIDEKDVPVFLILEALFFFLSVGPFAFTFFQAWSPVKHRALVGMTINAMVFLVSLVTALAHIPAVFSTRHKISGPNIMSATARSLVIPLGELVLLRPPLTTMSVSITVHSVLFATTGYFGNTFGNVGLAVTAGAAFNTTFHVMAFISERTNRLSFVHQLSEGRSVRFS